MDSPLLHQLLRPPFLIWICRCVVDLLSERRQTREGRSASLTPIAQDAEARDWSRRPQTIVETHVHQIVMSFLQTLPRKVAGLVRTMVAVVRLSIQFLETLVVETMLFTVGYLCFWISFRGFKN